MTREDETLRRMLTHALSGEGAHVECRSALDGLEWKLAGERPEGAPHSIHQLVSHMIYWNDWVVKWLEGENPPIPEHAPESWPGVVAPADAGEWNRTTLRFGSQLDELERRAREGDPFTMGVSLGAERSRLEMLQTIASHNSYHLGQIVLLRQMLGAWPPPKGGLTW